MLEDFDIEICRYEVRITFDKITHGVFQSNDITEAELYYNNKVEAYKNFDSHVKIELYDYNKNINTKDYDSNIDLL